MTVEELLFKMNIDPSGLDKGLRQARVQLAGLKDETEKTFLHAGSAARAFHKDIESLNEVVPGLGTALQFALDPVTGILTGIAIGFGYAKKKLEEYNAALDKTAERNAKPIFGQDQVDKLKEKQRELVDDQKEWERQLTAGDPIKKLTDSINEQITATGKLAQTAKVLPDLYKQYGQSLKDANSAAEKHTKLQEGLAKGPANLAEAQKQLEELQKKGEPQTISVGKVIGYGPSGAPITSGIDEEASARATEAVRAKYQESIRAATTKVNDARKAIADHEEEERKVKKELDEYKKKASEAAIAIDQTAKEQRILTAQVKKAQAAYDLQIGEVLQRQSEQRNAPYKASSLAELGQMNTPYGQIAREIGLARNASKFLGAQMTPEEFQAVNAQVIGLQGTARADLAAAGNDPHKRAAALTKYGQGLEDVLRARGQNPEARHLEGIEREIKNLNAKASAEGLVVRGSDAQ